MTDDLKMGDLVILVADKNMKFAVAGLLNRSEALDIQITLTYKVFVHPERDPGCLNEAVEFLRRYIRTYDHALVMFDYMGCGREHKKSKAEVESELEGLLAINGWGDRANVIVIDPELESWVWVDSPAFNRILRWTKESQSPFEWLVEQDYSQSLTQKPKNPKKAFQDFLRIVRKRRSSSLYMQLAEEIDFSTCIDPAFLKFRTILESWFPRST